LKVIILYWYPKDIGNETVINLKPAESKGSLTWLVMGLAIAAAFAFAAFTSGFGVGKYIELGGYLIGEKSATASAKPAGWSLLEDPDFSVAYPEGWEAKMRTPDEPAGAKIESVGGKVEVWLKIPRPYKISEEQKSKQASSKDSTTTVDSRNAQVEEFAYDSGGFFLVVEVPPKEQQPQLTFWATAANEDYKKTALDIIGSFKTNSRQK
jgi:hypothetical protein